MEKICNGCYYNKGSWCNCLVVSGGFGMNDRTADMYLKNNSCKHRREGKLENRGSKPNFNNS